MVSYIVQKANYSEFIGLSKDNKPNQAPNGSLFIEMDTNKQFRFDAESNEWIEPGKVAVKTAKGDKPTFEAKTTPAVVVAEEKHGEKTEMKSRQKSKSKKSEK